jgi:hypothetical protein
MSLAPELHLLNAQQFEQATCRLAFRGLSVNSQDKRKQSGSFLSGFAELYSCNLGAEIATLGKKVLFPIGICVASLRARYQARASEQRLAAHK